MRLVTQLDDMKRTQDKLSRTKRRSVSGIKLAPGTLSGSKSMKERVPSALDRSETPSSAEALRSDSFHTQKSENAVPFLPTIPGLAQPIAGRHG